MPRDLPILFSGPMVRALLAGAKCQTRRLVKPNPRDGAFYLLDGWPHRSLDGETNRRMGEEEPLPSPFGGPGDTLWVRETWCAISEPHQPGGGHYLYRADDGEAEHVITRAKAWKPSIFLPRGASRISLRVTSVRAERLGEISEADARAEGIPPNWIDDLRGFRPEEHGWLTPAGYRHVREHPEDDCDEGGTVGGVPAYVFSAREAFALWWDAIHGPGAWERDRERWVWVVGFERVEVADG